MACITHSPTIPLHSSTSLYTPITNDLKCCCCIWLWAFQHINKLHMQQLIKSHSSLRQHARQQQRQKQHRHWAQGSPRPVTRSTLTLRCLAASLSLSFPVAAFLSLSFPFAVCLPSCTAAPHMQLVKCFQAAKLLEKVYSVAAAAAAAVPLGFLGQTKVKFSG